LKKCDGLRSFFLEYRGNLPIMDAGKMRVWCTPFVAIVLWKKAKEQWKDFRIFPAYARD
jgi:hypothetical protein